MGSSTPKLAAAREHNKDSTRKKTINVRDTVKDTAAVPPPSGSQQDLKADLHWASHCLNLIIFHTDLSQTIGPGLRFPEITFQPGSAKVPGGFKGEAKRNPNSDLHTTVSLRFLTEN